MLHSFLTCIFIDEKPAIIYFFAPLYILCLSSQAALKISFLTRLLRNLVMMSWYSLFRLCACLRFVEIVGSTCLLFSPKAVRVKVRQRQKGKCGKERVWEGQRMKPRDCGTETWTHGERKTHWETEKDRSGWWGSCRRVEGASVGLEGTGNRLRGELGATEAGWEFEKKQSEGSKPNVARPFPALPQTCGSMYGSLFLPASDVGQLLSPRPHGPASGSSVFPSPCGPHSLELGSSHLCWPVPRLTPPSQGWATSSSWG